MAYFHKIELSIYLTWIPNIFPFQLIPLPFTVSTMVGAWFPRELFFLFKKFFSSFHDRKFLDKIHSFPTTAAQNSQKKWNENLKWAWMQPKGKREGKFFLFFSTRPIEISFYGWIISELWKCFKKIFCFFCYFSFSHSHSLTHSLLYP